MSTFSRLLRAADEIIFGSPPKTPTELAKAIMKDVHTLRQQLSCLQDDRIQGLCSEFGLRATETCEWGPLHNIADPQSRELLRMPSEIKEIFKRIGQMVRDYSAHGMPRSDNVMYHYKMMMGDIDQMPLGRLPDQLGMFADTLIRSDDIR